jgi:hypothetical protein
MKAEGGSQTSTSNTLWRRKQRPYITQYLTPERLNTLTPVFPRQDFGKVKKVSCKSDGLQGISYKAANKRRRLSRSWVFFLRISAHLRF